MTSKLSPGKKRKGTKSKESSPKVPVTTVTALFKRQLQQQETKDEVAHSSKLDDSDGDAVVIVEEEQMSHYFSPRKLHNSSDKPNIVDEVDSGNLLHTYGTRMRLSRRLSLRKKNQNLYSQGETGSSLHLSDAWVSETLSSNNNTICSGLKSQRLELSQEQEINEKSTLETGSTSEGDRRSSHLSVALISETLNNRNAVYPGSESQRLEPNREQKINEKTTSETALSRQLTPRVSNGEASGSPDEKSCSGITVCPEDRKTISIPSSDVALCQGDGRTVIEDRKTDGNTNKVQANMSSARGKLSLKRKSKIHKDTSANCSPPQKSCHTHAIQKGNSTPSQLVPDKEITNTTSSFSVFSIFKKSSVHLNCSSQSKQDNTVFTSEKKSSVNISYSPPTFKRETTPPSDERKSTERSKLNSEKPLLSDDQTTSSLSTTHDENTGIVDERSEEGDNNAGKEEDGENDEAKTYHVPYYLENFQAVLTTVFEDDLNIKLFDKTDLKHLASFNSLSDAAQKLYVRLFLRKLAWLSPSKIKYPEIAEDMAPCLTELVTAGLLLSGEELHDLSTVLKTLSALHLRTLAKAYHINPTGQKMGQIIQALLAKSQQNTVASLFGQNAGAVKDAMLKRAKKLLGPVYRLCREPRAAFMRAMMLFSLISTNGDDESGNGGQAQLFQMLMVNIGRVVYPAYTVSRNTQIFRCREDLIRFEDALQLETEFLGCTGSNNWNGAYSVFLTVKEQYDKLILDKEITDWDLSLPEFLRSYTTGSVLVRLMSQSIEILQRRKDYMAAVALIRELLGQKVYSLDHHGYWWERLALNLDVHLKRQEEALQAVQEGLADPLVRTGHRLALYLRAEAICNKPKSPFSKRLRDFYHEPLVDLPKAEVEGRVLPHTLPGSRYQFITSTSYAEGNTEEVTMCNVEQIVLDHYKVNGFPQGIHAEGSVVSTLFCIYFWDVIFMDVFDAFHSPYQTAPLDFHTDAFHHRRQDCIRDRLAKIEKCSEKELEEMLGERWDKENGVMCAGINWERFTAVEEVQGMVRCMGGKVLAGILGRYAEQPRHTRGGFPDLTLWNTSTRQLKISEVKGPGDRLSHKQMLWLNHLLKLGVDAEVCHVKPVGVKKLKPISKTGV